MMETPWRSSTHLPQSQHPAGRGGVNHANLISGTHRSSALCVCVAFCHWPRREFKCDYVPVNRGNHEIALQWLRNNREMRGKIMSLSGVLLTFLNVLKKTRVGTDRQKKIQSGASEEERERSNLHALLWLIKGTSQEEHSEGLCHYLRRRRWGPRLLGVNINMHIPMTNNTHISMPARESQFTAVRPFHYITLTVPPRLTIRELYCKNTHILHSHPLIIRFQDRAYGKTSQLVIRSCAIGGRQQTKTFVGRQVFKTTVRR